MEKLQVGIFGIGAVGSCIAAHLFQNEKLELSYYNRSHRDRIQWEYKNLNYSFPIELDNENQNQLKLDWLILCLKEYQIENSLYDLSKLISPNTKIAIIRNGINYYKYVDKIIDPSRILPCLIYCSAKMDRMKKVLQESPLEIYCPNSNLYEEFNRIFTDSHIVNSLEEERFKIKLWEKLIESCIVGAICFQSGQGIGVIKKEPYNQLKDILINETLSIARASGIKLAPNFKEKLEEKMFRYPSDKTSSLIHDKQLGRRLELEAKHGLLITHANEHNLGTPELDKIYNLMLEYNNSIELK